MVYCLVWGTERPVGDTTFVFHPDGTMSCRARPVPKAQSEKTWRYSINRTSIPNELDWHMDANRVYFGTFKLENERLTVCWSPNIQSERPSSCDLSEVGHGYVLELISRDWSFW